MIYMDRLINAILTQKKFPKSKKSYYHVFNGGYNRIDIFKYIEKYHDKHKSFPEGDFIEAKFRIPHKRTLDKYEEYSYAYKEVFTDVEEIFKEILRGNLNSEIMQLMQKFNTFRTEMANGMRFSIFKSRCISEVDNFIDSVSYVESKNRSEDFMDDLEIMNYSNKPLRIGFKSFNDLDLFGGHLIHLLARTGIGKTWFMLFMALEAVKQGKRVTIASFEMTKIEIIIRLCSLHFGINSKDIRRNNLTETQRTNIREFTNDLDSKINIVTEHLYGVNSIKQECINFRTDVVFVDYFDLIKDDNKGFNSFERAKNISSDLKRSLAMSLNIPVILVIQANRLSISDNRAQEEVLPQVEHIANSDAIGRDSDLVISMGRSKKMYDEHILKIEVIKTRHDCYPSAFLTFDIAGGDIHENENYNGLNNSKPVKKEPS